MSSRQWLSGLPTQADAFAAYGTATAMQGGCRPVRYERKLVEVLREVQMLQQFTVTPPVVTLKVCSQQNAFPLFFGFFLFSFFCQRAIARALLVTWRQCDR